MGFRFLIARRYLARRREVSLISVITGISTVGVALGVAALIVVLSVMNGFYDFVRDLLVSLDPHVRIVSTDARGLADADSLMKVALTLPAVRHAAPYVEGKALLAYAGSVEANQVVVVRGVVPDSLGGVSRVVEQTGYGAFSVERAGGEPGIVVGMSLARRLGLLPGSDLRAADQVALLSAPALERAFTQLFGAAPAPRFAVRGLYEIQPTYEESHVFIGLREAQRLFRMEGRVSGVELRLRDLEAAEAVKNALAQRLSAEQYTVKTWYDLQASLYDVMRLEKWGASAILALIVVVAAFNIVGSLTMVVIEKRRDVGVLRAMGTSRKDIRRIFLLEGLLIGGVGTGAGLALGLALAFLQQAFQLVPLAGAESFLIDAYPVSIRLSDVALITAATLALCVLAALYPALRAAAIEPARAVQLEG